MNILFVHNNFPGQFRHIAEALARDPKLTVVAVGSPSSRPVPRVRLLKYSMNRVDVTATHPFARRFDMECHRAEQVLYVLTSLVSSGFAADVIVAHPGWGETLPLRTIFPRARIVLYCEFFYGTEGRDVGFDPEFPQIGADGDVALHLKNAATLLALAECDVGLSPTIWQRSTFPEIYQPNIRVIHEGVNTEVIKPQADAAFRLGTGRTLRREDEVVTFVARNLEPLRGYHIFMRALPRILKERPRAQILVIGEDRTYYGASPPAGITWKSIFLNEVSDRIDVEQSSFHRALDLSRLPESVADIFGARVSHLSVCAVLVIHRGHELRLCAHRLRYHTGSRGREWREWRAGSFLRSRPPGRRSDRGARPAAPFSIDAGGGSPHRRRAI